MYKDIFPGLNINADYIEDNDPIIVISTLLKNNDVGKIGKILNSLSYSNSEIENIKFLISLLSLSSENAYDLKKIQKRTDLSNNQILRFLRINNIDDKLINSFLNYNISTTGDDVMGIYNIEPGPSVGKYIQQMELEKFKDMHGTNESYKSKYVKTFINFNKIDEAALPGSPAFADTLSSNIKVKEIPRGSNRGEEI